MTGERLNFREWLEETREQGYRMHPAQARMMHSSSRMVITSAGRVNWFGDYLRRRFEVKHD